MFSMPPATATLALPSKIPWAADTIACAPEPQTRFTVMSWDRHRQAGVNRRLTRDSS